MDELEALIRRLGRPTSLLVLDEDNCAEAVVRSWFGRVTLQAKGERWPVHNNRLMWPVLQIVTNELPYRPDSLRDIALIRVYVDPSFLCDVETGGASYYHPEGVDGPGWLLRASPTLEGLVVTDEPDHGSLIKAAPGRWELVEKDYPSFDHLPLGLPEWLSEAYCDYGPETVEGTKVGGWPLTVQGRLYWDTFEEHPLSPEYVFQIDSDPERGWFWGDLGVAYFGRGTGPHRDKWEMDWQCM